MPPLGPRFRGDDNVGRRDDSVGACWRIIVKLKDVYPLYLNNKAVPPNTDLVVTDKFTGAVAFRTALATPDVIDEAIAGPVRAAAPLARLATRSGSATSRERG